MNAAGWPSPRIWMYCGPVGFFLDRDEKNGEQDAPLFMLTVVRKRISPRVVEQEYTGSCVIKCLDQYLYCSLFSVEPSLKLPQTFMTHSRRPQKQCNYGTYSSCCVPV